MTILTREDPSVKSWLKTLKDSSNEELLSVVRGDPDEVDASHFYACSLILEDRGFKPAQDYYPGHPDIEY